MSVPLDGLSIYIAIIGTIISALLAYLSYSLSRQSQRATMQRSIEDIYDKMVRYRAEHPEVMKLCYRWNSESFDAIYRQLNAEEVQWVNYYNYAELVSGFLNAVLYGRKIKLLDRHAYEGHYKPLVKLLVTENYPYFLSILDAPYLSAFIRDFINDLKSEGWDFAGKHKRLVGAVEYPKPSKKRKAQ
jgi:hypothetical protein